MMRIHHWGAALAMLCLVSLVHTETGPIAQVSNPELRAMFLSHSSNGNYLYRDQLQKLLPNKFKQIQYMNDELLEELVVYADENEDGKLNMKEFTKLAEFITKDRSH